MLPKEHNDLLVSWAAADKAKDDAIAEEKRLRELVISTFSSRKDEMESGTESIDLGWDSWQLKIAHKLNYKLGNAGLVKTALAQIAAAGENGPFIAERLVKWEPEISVSEYKKLDGGQKKIIDTVLTIKPASKAIEIVQAKK